MGDLMYHSDRGSQFKSVAFAQRCKFAGIRPSMGSRGDCYDNAMCESFEATLECEFVGIRQKKNSSQKLFCTIARDKVRRINLANLCGLVDLTRAVEVRNARWPIGRRPSVPYRVSPTDSDVKLMVQVFFIANVVKFRTLSKIAVS